MEPLFCSALQGGLFMHLPSSGMLTALRLTMFRGTEVVEGVLRHHISACFAALQRKLLDLLHGALPALCSVSANAPSAKAFPGAPQHSPAIEVELPHSPCCLRLHLLGSYATFWQCELYAELSCVSVCHMSGRNIFFLAYRMKDDWQEAGIQSLL